MGPDEREGLEEKMSRAHKVNDSGEWSLDR